MHFPQISNSFPHTLWKGINNAYTLIKPFLIEKKHNLYVYVLKREVFCAGKALVFPNDCLPLLISEVSRITLEVNSERRNLLVLRVIQRVKNREQVITVLSNFQQTDCNFFRHV